jgi:hypothetical protein
MNKQEMLKGVCWPSEPKVKQTHCHKLIARTAAGMAFEIYDKLMERNDWYEEWKRKNPDLSGEALANEFVRRIWPTLIDDARATLAGMLACPLDEGLKEEIYQALCLDSQLIRGRGRATTLQ